jgi:hypothetical protein
LIVLLALILIVRSQSRGQLLAFVAATVLFYGASRSRSAGGQIWRIAIVMCFVSLAAYLAFGMVDDVSSRRWETDFMTADYAQTRGEMCKVLLSYWWTSSPLHWLVGLGTSASYDTRLLGFYPHVIPVEVLGELGLVGLGWYCAILFFAARSWFRLMRMHALDRVNRGMVAALGALILFGFLLTLKQGTLLSHISYLMFIVLLFRYEYFSERALARDRAIKAYRWWWYQQMNQLANQGSPGVSPA